MHRGEKQRRFRYLTVLALSCVLMAGFISASGCGALIRKTTRPMMENLTKSVMKQKDLELVRQGAPAYLMLMDGLVEGSPDNPEILAAAAQLYTAYAMAFTLEEDPERALLMTERAKDYAVRALALENDAFAELYDKPAAEFEAVPPTLGKDDVKYMHTVINAWASYIMARTGSWDDIADVPKVQALAQRLLELDETYAYGSAHMFMGILYSLLPADLGGKPDQAKEHFERAIAISKGRNLQAQVAFASRYCRLVYDRELHDKLLQEVLDAPDDLEPDLTLSNTLAKKQAEKLLADADEYF